MITRNILYYTLSGVFLASCTGRNQTENEIRPNIIFIMSDDHATQAISSYGSRLNQTPNIDKLARQGILFRNAYVTNAICAPSRAVILTGKHSHINGVKDNSARFDSSQLTFPKILKDHGYQTAIVGKWHLKSQPTGFDYWNVLPGQGDYYNPGFINNGKDTVYQGYVTSITTDIAIEWMKQRDPNKPFLLMIHHKAPHRNWMPHTQNLDKYENIKFPVPGNFYEDYSLKEHLMHQKLTVARHLDITYDLKIPCDTCQSAQVNWWAENAYQKALARMNDRQRKAWQEGFEEEISEFRKKEFSAKEYAEWKLQRYLQDYLRTIISVDESVGDVLTYLEENNLSENTLVVYTSDQGFFLGEHGLFDKRYMYEESLHTPLVMMYPQKITEGIKSDELVQNLDIAPTLLDLAGVKIPAGMQGCSLVPLMKNGKSDDWRESIYYQFYETGWGVTPHYGIRTKDFKLIHFVNGSNSWEMYDLSKDPHEMNNLYENKKYKAKRKNLKDKLRELRKKYQIPLESDFN